MVALAQIRAALRQFSQRVSSPLRIRARYTRALEEEVARLRAENRALVNSILGVAGIPPLRAVANSLAPRSSPALAAASFSPARKSPSAQTEVRALDAAAVPAAPLRRRSWQQRGRLREIEDARAARRERESNPDTFPAPRNAVLRP